MAALPRWPAVGELERRPVDEEERQRRAKRRQAQRAERAEMRRRAWACNAATYDWRTWRTTTRCAACLATRSGKLGPCAGVDAHPLAKLAEQARGHGHKLWVAAVEGEVPDAAAALAVCRLCGGWAMGRRGGSLKLARPCSEAPTEAGRQAWHRLGKGALPHGRPRLRTLQRDGAGTVARRGGGGGRRGQRRRRRGGHPAGAAGGGDEGRRVQRRGAALGRRQRLGLRCQRGRRSSLLCRGAARRRQRLGLRCQRPGLTPPKAVVVGGTHSVSALLCEQNCTKECRCQC